MADDNMMMITWSWKHGLRQMIASISFKGKVCETGSLGQVQQRRWKSRTLLWALITVGAIGTWHHHLSRLMWSPVGRSECVGSHMALNVSLHTSWTLHPIFSPDTALERSYASPVCSITYAALLPCPFNIDFVPVLNKETKIDQSYLLLIW